MSYARKTGYRIPDAPAMTGVKVRTTPTKCPMTMVLRPCLEKKRVRRLEVMLLEEPRVLLLEQRGPQPPTDEVTQLTARDGGDRGARCEGPDVDGGIRLRRDQARREQQGVTGQEREQLADDLG